MPETSITPTVTQAALAVCPCRTIFFGGARGGGKTHGMGIKALYHATKYGANANMLFLRQSLPELEDPINKYKQLYSGIADWKEQKKTFVFYNGARFRFAYLDGESVDKYQGHEYTQIFMDEAGQFQSWDDIRTMYASCRSSRGVPCQIIMSGNPGGRLHGTLKAYFVDCAPPGTPIPDGWDELGNPLTYKIFIPSKLSDNPHLLKNDPLYVENLKKSGNPELVRQWLEGDWNSISGGMWDYLWDDNVLVVPPFSVPRTWRIIKGYDYGSSRPWACCWFAISDGSDLRLNDGTELPTLPDDIFMIDEIYGCDEKSATPNVGDKKSIQVQAQRILDKEYFKGYKCSQSIADSAIFTNFSGSYCVSDEFSKAGIDWRRCDKRPGSRAQAAQLFRNRLLASLERDGEPGFFVCANCRNTLRTVPVLQQDKRDADIPDTRQEDHIYDVISYILLSQNRTEVFSLDAANCY